MPKIPISVLLNCSTSLASEAVARNEIRRRVRFRNGIESNILENVRIPGGEESMIIAMLLDLQVKLSYPVQPRILKENSCQEAQNVKIM